MIEDTDSKIVLKKTFKGVIMKPIIIFEDKHIIVCKKPAGIPTQTRHISQPDMVSILKNHLAENTTANVEPYLGVIHRLDQPVEGLLVFAKTPFAAKELSRQITSQQFHKHYRATLCGTPPKTSDTLTDFLVKLPKENRSKIGTAKDANAKKAVLTYTVRDGFNSTDLTEVDIELQTGRHHQIRVQMANMSCPILGDTKYNPQPFPSGEQLPLALCACKLEFFHPKSKETLSF